METEEEVKLLSQIPVYGIRKLTRVGDSWGVILPKAWLDMYATIIDDDCYIQADYSGETLVFRPINPADIEEIEVKKK